MDHQSPRSSVFVVPLLCAIGVGVAFLLLPIMQTRIFNLTNDLTGLTFIEGIFRDPEPAFLPWLAVPAGALLGLAAAIGGKRQLAIFSGLVCVGLYIYMFFTPAVLSPNAMGPRYVEIVADLLSYGYWVGGASSVLLLLSSIFAPAASAASTRPSVTPPAPAPLKLELPD